MPSCPINLSPIAGNSGYSEAGLKEVHPKLIGLAPLQYSAEEQLRQARLRADKMSIQGVQPKLSAILRISSR
jgi:serine/threonine-protein kinase HipA